MDAAEARECGRQAVICATEADVDGSIVMRRAGGRKYAVEYDRTDLSNVARHTKSLPDEFIAPEGNDVTEAFLSYVRPLVGRLPAVGFLKGM